MTTNGVTNNYGSYVVDNYGSPNSLTGESLMLWLSIKLDGVDSELNGMLNGQTENLKKKEVLQKYKQCLTAMKDASAEEKAQARAEFQKYRNSLKGGPYYDLAFDLHEGTMHYLDARGGHFDVEIASVSDQIEALDKNSELSMIRVNQLMSQRQTMVQLAQSIMNKQNETLEGIVKKFG